MTKQWSLKLLPFALPLVLSVVLAACSQSQSREVVAAEDMGAVGAGYPARLQLSGLEIAADVAPVQPEGAAWRSDAGGLHFAVPGAADLLAISCSHAQDGTAQIKLTRGTRAEDGAKALFAVIGNGRIARLPLDAVRAGDDGEWQGLIPAADPQLDVLKGGNRLEATLPGGGLLKLPASGEPGRLLEACRASDRGPAPAV
jgi:hypothetical protein